LHQKINNIKIFSSFWFLLCLYLVIPVFIDSISVPSWFYYFDEGIPFIPLMIIPYYFYYFIIILPPLLWNNELKIRNITSILNAITIICYLVFIFWPIDASYILNQVHFDQPSFIIYFHNFITYDYLHQNAFPSMHVAVATFLCLSYYHDFTKFRGISLTIAFLIFLATFFIKQHYFIDSVAGLFLGLLGFYCYVIKTRSCD
jgi:hypothetical protein